MAEKLRPETLPPAGQFKAAGQGVFLGFKTFQTSEALKENTKNEDGWQNPLLLK